MNRGIPCSGAAACGCRRRRARLNGRWMHDWSDLDSVWLDEPGEADQTRRLRLLLQGEWNARLAFKTQGEFKGDDPHLLEWWINWKTPDQPSLRVGHFREPFGLDARTTSAHITFVERSSPTPALTFSRNRGLEVHKSDTSSSWATECGSRPIPRSTLPARARTPGPSQLSTAATCKSVRC